VLLLEPVLVPLVGALKSWRVLIMINYAYINLKKMIHPNAVISLKIGNKSVENDVAASVWGFFSIYVISFIVLLLRAGSYRA
jgi:trk system potassium uptake protein TrkH